MHVSYEALGVVITLLLQTGIIVWWASQISSKVSHQHACMHRIEAIIHEKDKKIEALFRKLDEHTADIAVLMERSKRHGETS